MRGVQRVAGWLAPEAAAALLARLEPVYAQARALAQTSGGGEGRGEGHGQGGFNLHSSSLNLGRAPALDVNAWWPPSGAAGLRRAALAAIGPGAWLAPEHCWLRRQFPAAVAPPGHAPHSWHQDGALLADFTRRPLPPPLTMLTCWIALTPCGLDAPSLEWVDAELPELLPPDALAPTAVARRFPPASWQHATLAAGDALLFDGTLLHRTHLTPAMQAVRSSLELRLFAADGATGRLAGERRLPLG